jgi:plasmid stabilization system protein ParE
MPFAVVLLPHAEIDLEQILSWLNQRSPRGAKLWLNRWNEALQSLEDSADRCGEAPESERHTHRIQQFVFRTRKGNPYRIIFSIRENVVYIIHIRGMGQAILPDNSFPELP